MLHVNELVFKVNIYTDVAVHSKCRRALLLISNPFWLKHTILLTFLYFSFSAFPVCFTHLAFCVFIRPCFFLLLYIFPACCFHPVMPLHRRCLPLTSLSLSPFAVTVFREMIVYCFVCPYCPPKLSSVVSEEVNSNQLLCFLIWGVTYFAFRMFGLLNVSFFHQDRIYKITCIFETTCPPTPQKICLHVVYSSRSETN